MNSVFGNISDKDAILRNIYRDIMAGKTTKEISGDYGFTERQIRYIRNYYLCIHKQGGRRRKAMNNDTDEKVIQIDENNFLVGDKMATRATPESLMKKIKDRKLLKNKNKNNTTK